MTPVALVKSDAVVHSIFGLASETFEDQLREPAGTFRSFFFFFNFCSYSYLIWVASIKVGFSICKHCLANSFEVGLLGGFLEITSSLFPLEAALLFALASGSLLAADRVRAGGCLALTSALTLGGLGIATLDPAFWKVRASNLMNACYGT